MVIVTGRRGARAMPWLRLLALLPISLLVGHEAVFAVQYGLGQAFGEAMTAGGHDGYWAAFNVVILALTAGLLAREGVRALRARRRLGHLGDTAPARRMAGGATGGRPRAIASWRREFKAIWPALFAVTAVAFAIQENIEHLAAGQAPHGLGSLVGSEHPAAIPVLALISAAVAAGGALIRWRVRILEVRLARAASAVSHRRRHDATAPAAGWPLVGALRAHSWFLVRLDAGRAPPPTG